MRKVDPNDVRTDFASTSQQVVDHFDRLAAVVAGTTREADISQLATQSFLALFVAFERFTSDLLFAYLNRDPSAYQAALSNRIKSSVKDKHGAAASARVTVHTKKHLSLAELEDLVDPTGWNLTFNTVDKLKDYATANLAQAHRNRLNSINAHETRLIDTARTIRDFIAHQSDGSKKRMHDALATVETGAHNRHLGRGGNKVQSIGACLKAAPAGQMRLHRYASGLVAIATHM